MARTLKRSGESKYQVAKDGANHKLDRILRELETKKETKKSKHNGKSNSK